MRYVCGWFTGLWRVFSPKPDVSYRQFGAALYKLLQRQLGQDWLSSDYWREFIFESVRTYSVLYTGVARETAKLSAAEWLKETYGLSADSHEPLREAAFQGRVDALRIMHHVFGTAKAVADREPQSGFSEDYSELLSLFSKARSEAAAIDYCARISELTRPLPASVHNPGSSVEARTTVRKAS
jgi:hypothetical protein